MLFPLQNDKLLPQSDILKYQPLGRNLVRKNSTDILKEKKKIRKKKPFSSL